MAAYRFFPANPPPLKKIIPGVLVCVIAHQAFGSGFSQLIDPDRYNLLYGALGRLFIFLMNVYFFFVFFFFGAQLIKTLSIFDALLFIRFRQVHSRLIKPEKLVDKIFASLSGPLKKYTVFYKTGENIFTRGTDGQEVYYIISGKAGVYLVSQFQNKIARIDEANFFGEMASITSDGRAASIQAESELSVLVLPPELFRTILEIDPETDHNLIKALSEKLKSINEQISISGR
jgi:membrane protein